MDLCHVGVLRAIIENDANAQKDESALYTLLRAKDVPALQEITAAYGDESRRALLALPSLYGDVTVLARARKELPALPGITKALDELAALASLAGEANVTIDLADLGGYQYESGAMFAIYVPGLPMRLRVVVVTITLAKHLDVRVRRLVSLWIYANWRAYCQ